MSSDARNSADEPRGECALIRRIADVIRTTYPAGPVPFGDDMAVLGADAGGWLWTVDMLMDGVDFDSEQHDWRAIGRKALAVNLSDCAAMAVQPAGALIAVALSNRLGMDDALALFRGAHELGRDNACPITGGDTNSWEAPTAISITVAARPWPGIIPVRRDGARPGDSVWVTGPLGGSILGRHMSFEPRVQTARDIAERLRPHALMDISDGLALDLGRMLEASGTGAVLDRDLLAGAVHDDARRLSGSDGRPALEHALHDGEDFELIVIVGSKVTAEECRAAGLLPLGGVVAERGLWLESAAGRESVPQTGWEHFR